MIKLIPVDPSCDLPRLEKVASEIWGEYWPAIIGEDQTKYMIKMFHSIEAMQRDISEHGYRFWFAEDEEGNIVGYTGGAAEINTGDPEIDAANSHNPVVQQRWDRRFFVSKVYLYKDQRGKHYASEMIKFYEELCKAEQYDVMYLTVNVNNTLGIRAYLGNGFDIVADQVAEIGNGFVMNDHIMAKEISRA